MVGEVEVLFIAPRHPNKGIKMTQPMTWKEALSDINENLDGGIGELDQSFMPRRSTGWRSVAASVVMVTQ